MASRHATLHLIWGLTVGVIMQALTTVAVSTTCMYHSRVSLLEDITQGDDDVFSFTRTALADVDPEAEIVFSKQMFSRFYSCSEESQKCSFATQFQTSIDGKKRYRASLDTSASSSNGVSGRYFECTIPGILSSAGDTISCTNKTETNSECFRLSAVCITVNLKAASSSSSSVSLIWRSRGNITVVYDPSYLSIKECVYSGDNGAKRIGKDFNTTVLFIVMICVFIAMTKL